MRRIVFIFAILLVGCGTDGPKPESDSGTDAGSTDVSTGEDATAADMSTGTDLSTGEDASSGSDASGSDTSTGEDMSNADAGPDMPPDTGTDAAPDMPSGPDGDTCDVAIDATAGGTFTGDTSSAADDYSASALDTGCPSGVASGGDVVYVLQPTVETTFDLTVTPDDGAFDPFIYIRTDCALDECVDGSVLNGPGDPEGLSDVTVPANTPYFVIVDGELGSSGAYTFEVVVQ